MPLTIPDTVLESAGFDERTAQVDIACRWYAAKLLSKSGVCRWLGMTRSEVEEELLSRGLPLFFVEVEDLEEDLRSLRRLRERDGKL